MKPIAFALLLCLALPAAAADVEKEKAALLAGFASSRKAHLERDPDLLVAGLADHVLNARNGELKWATREEMRTNFTRYFQSVRFQEWDATEAPVVSVSPDGNMGWMAVRVRVRYTGQDEKGAEKETRFVSSWVAAFEKQQGEWKMVAISSDVVEQPNP